MYNKNLQIDKKRKIVKILPQVRGTSEKRKYPPHKKNNYLRTTNPERVLGHKSEAKAPPCTSKTKMNCISS